MTATPREGERRVRTLSNDLVELGVTTRRSDRAALRKDGRPLSMVEPSTDASQRALGAPRAGHARAHRRGPLAWEQRRNDQREFVAVNLCLALRFEALDRVNAAQRA